MSTSLAHSGIENPIVIDDDEPLPERAAVVPHKKKQRTRKWDGKAETLQETPTPKDGFIQVQELLRSSEKIVVISGAGISANAGCRLNFT